MNSNFKENEDQVNCEEGKPCLRINGVTDPFAELPQYVIYGAIGVAALLLLIILFFVIRLLRKSRNRGEILEPDSLKSGTYRAESNKYKSPDDGYIPPRVQAYSYTPAQSNESGTNIDDGYLAPRNDSQTEGYLQE